MSGPTDIPEDLRQALDTFHRECSAISDEFPENSTTAPSLIYHYTTGEGLRGILETGTLRFTDIFDLNDPSELRHGLRYAYDALCAASDTPDMKQFSEGFAAFMKSGILEAGHFLVCCFSCNGDELVQWRAYADDGRGFAIGFDTAILTEAFSENKKDASHGPIKIDYGDVGLKDVQERLTAKLRPMVSLIGNRALRPEQRVSYKLELATRFATSAIINAIQYKHGAYEKEGEYRLLQVYRNNQPIPGLRYHARASRLVRYNEFDWRLHAAASLKKIVIGPAADPSTAEEFVNACLTRYFGDPDEVSVSQSPIPYRSV